MSFAQSAAQSMIQGVTFRSTITPAYTYDPWAQASGAAPARGGFDPLSFLKPTFDVQTPAGPITIAPYGDPGDTNYLPFLAVGALATAIGVVVLIGWIARKIK